MAATQRSDLAVVAAAAAAGAAASCRDLFSGAFQVQGPHDPLVAMLGGEAELPCFLSPPQSIKNMQISWNRSLPSRVVHLYEDGRDKPEEAMVEYLGRTELVKNVMHKGIVVLKILNVQPSDNGQYCCEFKNGSFYNDTVIELKVAGAFQVQGPHDPLVAMLGGEAELPCFLSPPQSIKNMQISWNRSLPSRVVHLYEDGRDKPEEAMVEYLGRTELVKNVMHKGIVVLKILNVQPSDNGQYCCEFKNGSFYNDTVIELKVAALGSHPQFHVEVTRSRQVRLECTSEGWFPQPKVQWMDSEGREIPAESETHTQDKDGLFHVTTSLLLRETSQKNLTCSVWNPVLNQKTEEQLCICTDNVHFGMSHQYVKGAFQVQGPHDPLVAMLGGEAELPCFLSPPQSIKNMQISWNRSLPSRVVHLYEYGRDKPEEAMKEYFKRTKLVENVMHKGIVVLRILTIQPSDNGQYHCVIQNGSFYSDTMIELKVAAIGSHPQFHVEVTKSRQLRLECKSEGWFPQPKVQWTDSEGGEIPAESETHTQDKGGLFHVTTSLVLRETSQKNLTCSVWNPDLDQKKEEQLSIAVPADHVEFYAESNSEGASANAPGPSILAYTCVAATNPDQDGASAHAPRTAPASEEDHNTSPDQDGASADPPGAALHKDAPKATNAKLDPEAACTYSPGAAPAEVHDTISSSASKAFEEVQLDFKYDPKKKAELQGTTERFTGLSMGPYLQKGPEGIILRELTNKLQPDSVSRINHPMQSRHPLENLSNFNKAIVSHL
ncbi:Butyrophilin-like protein 2 [Myotis davidii]|uniref:Butyrophilin-like protein 2 n=1 Tax=Myotis davidii TaxID=225400 RepID=L5LVB0_MYODS|nr:Butyrophilin-like protein 2 [Myotis davidii]